MAPSSEPAVGGHQTVGALIDTVATRTGQALVSPARATDYSAAAVATGVRKAANLVHHYGVGRDRRLAVVVGPKDPRPSADPGWLGPAADPLLALLGGLLLGAPVDPAPDPPVDTAALVVPTAWLDRYPVSPGTSVLAYGGPPTVPEVSHFERERWSENAVRPPEPVAPETPAVHGTDAVYSHRDLLAATATVLAAHPVDEADRLRLAAPIDRPETLVAGALAPLAVGTPIQPVPQAAAERRGIVLQTGDTERHIDPSGLGLSDDDSGVFDPGAES